MESVQGMEAGRLDLPVGRPGVRCSDLKLVSRNIRNTGSYGYIGKKYEELSIP